MSSSPSNASASVSSSSSSANNLRKGTPVPTADLAEQARNASHQRLLGHKTPLVPPSSSSTNAPGNSPFASMKAQMSSTPSATVTTTSAVSATSSPKSPFASANSAVAAAKSSSSNENASTMTGTSSKDDNVTGTGGATATTAATTEAGVSAIGGAGAARASGDTITSLSGGSMSSSKPASGFGRKATPMPGSLADDSQKIKAARASKYSGALPKVSESG